MDEKEKPPDEFFKCVKVPLKHVIKHPDINIPKIRLKLFQFPNILLGRWLLLQPQVQDYVEFCLAIGYSVNFYPRFIFNNIL